VAGIVGDAAVVGMRGVDDERDGARAGGEDLRHAGGELAPGRLLLPGEGEEQRR
jgi:hypothetical protein